MSLQQKPKRRREKRMPVTMDAVIGEYLASLKLRDLSPSTIVTYDKVLSHFRDYIRRGQPEDTRVPFTAVSLRNARGYIAAKLGQETLYSDHPLHKEREGKLSPHTVHQHVRVLRAFGHWLTKNDYAGTGLENLEAPKLPENLIDILSPEEIDLLYNLHSPNTLIGSRWRATFAFFLQTGVRVSELIHLKMDDLEMDHYRAKIRNGKGPKDRYVSFGAKTWAPLDQYIRFYRPEHGDCVFLSLDGQAMTVSGIEQMVRNARSKSGIKKLHCHLLRHTFATSYLMAGGSAFELQEQLGHATLEMTRKYVHLANILAKTGAQPEQVERRRSMLDKMPGLGSSPEGRRTRPRGAGSLRPRRSAPALEPVG